MSAQHSREVVGIAAVGGNGVIGADGDIPWRIAEDWRRFKALTMGHVLIMGRRTYDSIGRPLPGRSTIVVTRDPQWPRTGELPPNVWAATSLDEAFATATEQFPGATVFVAGGGEIYRAAWPRLDRLELTEVDRSPEGNVTLPAISSAEWAETNRDQRDGYAFVSYRRIGSTRDTDDPGR
ncbi:dihydrofolate reductase [Microlunatus panaciterrae]|uniref:Dihydrofolate reductase n=1 Tax=Microlunatus panaciterrae TaxID=400768 RepID=A0ABS2RMB0_9ACTN|nr:dihydrofolate reductase [Microlunatus panaciterrae]MBM7799818.1 dihydrofolate reductase [Microlunatus panaciterrae]